MRLFLWRTWHIISPTGHGRHFEMGVFYSRCRRCRRAWATTSSGALHGLIGQPARIILDDTPAAAFGVEGATL